MLSFPSSFNIQHDLNRGASLSLFDTQRGCDTLALQTKELNPQRNDMKLNKQNATNTDKGRVKYGISFCGRHNQELNGFAYNDDLAGPNGIHLELLVTERAEDDACKEALALGYANFDVVSHAVLVCPPSWFPRSEVAA